MLDILINKVMLEGKLSTRDVAKSTGVSHTTIIRALRGEAVDVATVFKLSKWLAVKPHTLLNSMADMDDNLPDQIAVLLEGNQVLSKEFEKAITAIRKGNVDPSIIEDIASYASYKINLKTMKKA